MDRKLSFWLPFRAGTQKRTNAYIKELKIDFGDKAFNREQLESELAARFNKIQIKKIDDANESMNEEVKQNNIDDSLDFLDPLKMMENNLGNISAIQPHMYLQ